MGPADWIENYTHSASLQSNLVEYDFLVSHEFVQCGKDKGSRDITLFNEKEQGV